MKRKIENLCDMRFGKWTVLGDYVCIKNGGTTRIGWMVCKCDCGKIQTVRAGDLKSGKSKSCGCLNKK